MSVDEWVIVRAEHGHGTWSAVCIRLGEVRRVVGVGQAGYGAITVVHLKGLRIHGTWLPHGRMEHVGRAGRDPGVVKKGDESRW